MGASREAALLHRLAGTGKVLIVLLAVVIPQERRGKADHYHSTAFSDPAHHVVADIALKTGCKVP